MHPDVPPGLLDLQRHADHLAEVARTVAAAKPAQSKGTDTTGCARVTIDPDGLPVELRVVERWQRLCAADKLSAAVLEAYEDALRVALATWPTGKLDERPLHPSPQHQTPSAPTPPTGQVTESTELAERAITNLQRLQRMPTGASAVHEGSDGKRHVTIQLGSGGLTACKIDPQWAAGRGGTVITDGLATALRHANASRAAASAPQQDLDSFLGDALATFSALTQMPLSGSEDR